MITMKQSVLFICTHNSARSQMAEGLLRHLAGDRFEVASAGTEATHVRPLAIEAMRELGIDITSQTSKTIASLDGRSFDVAISVCDSANEACPVFPSSTKRLHWSFDDPSGAKGTDEERLAMFRRVRDEIRARIEEFIA
jgi:arsenate reductase